MARATGSGLDLGVKENDGGGWQLFFRILENLGERLLTVVPSVQRAQRSTLIPGTSMPRGALRVLEPGSIEPVSVELWLRYQRGRGCSSSEKVRFLQADHSRRWRGPALCATQIRRASFLR